MTRTISVRNPPVDPERRTTFAVHHVYAVRQHFNAAPS